VHVTDLLETHDRKLSALANSWSYGQGRRG
jgi:hypothetical protein